MMKYPQVGEVKLKTKLEVQEMKVVKVILKLLIEQMTQFCIFKEIWQIFYAIFLKQIKWSESWKSLNKYLSSEKFFSFFVIHEPFAFQTFNFYGRFLRDNN